MKKIILFLLISLTFILPIFAQETEEELQSFIILEQKDHPDYFKNAEKYIDFLLQSDPKMTSMALTWMKMDDLTCDELRPYVREVLDNTNIGHVDRIIFELVSNSNKPEDVEIAKSVVERQKNNKRFIRRVIKVIQKQKNPRPDLMNLVGQAYAQTEYSSSDWVTLHLFLELGIIPGISDGTKRLMLYRAMRSFPVTGSTSFSGPRKELRFDNYSILLAMGMSLDSGFSNFEKSELARHLLKNLNVNRKLRNDEKKSLQRLRPLFEASSHISESDKVIVENLLKQD